MSYSYKLEHIKMQSDMYLKPAHISQLSFDILRHCTLISKDIISFLFHSLSSAQGVQNLLAQRDVAEQLHQLRFLCWKYWRGSPHR